MKRYKKGTSFFIDCACCGSFVADASTSALFAGVEGKAFRNWQCPKCGQLFTEAVGEPIMLEPSE